MFRTAILTIAAAISIASFANTAQATKYDNNRKANGISLNGITLNGVQLNGRQLNGVATAADALTFSAITLADGTKLAIVK